MKPLYLITLLIIALSSCKKNDDLNYDITNPLYGTWTSGSYSFKISNFDGTPTPFIITKKSDSLFVKLMPLIDLRYKIVSINAKFLIVSDNTKTITYTRTKL